MTIETVIAMALIGALVGYLTSLIVRADNFNILVHILVGILGSVLAGAVIPDTMIFKPVVIEHLLRATVGAIVIQIVVGLIRHV